MKHELSYELLIHASKDWQNNVVFSAKSCDMSDYGYTYIGITKTVTIEFEAPDDFNLTEFEIEALRKQQKKIQADAQRQVVEIEERIQSMLAIEYKPAEV